MGESTEPGKDLAAIRRHNLERVAEAIRDQPNISQGELVTRLELAAGAISSLVNALVEADIVEETSSRPPSGRGRPRRRFELSDRWADVIGIRLNRSGAEVRATTLRGTTLARRTTAFDHAPAPHAAGAAVTALLSATTAGLIRPHHAAPRLVVSIPGVNQNGSISSEELEWFGIPDSAITGPMRDAGFDNIEIGNDGSYAALAEWRAGAAAGHDNTVVVLLGRGLGGSAAIDGRLVRGNGDAPGFGHTPVDPSGEVCLCGLRGCIELSVSLHSFAAHLDEAATLDAIPSAAYADDLRRRAETGDTGVLALLDEARLRLREFSDIAVSLLTPEVLVLTGTGARLAPWLLTTHVGNMQIPMISGALGGDAPIVGATLAAIDAYLADPLTGE